MKATVVLFTATLFAICSAFPIHEETMRCQQFCTTVTHRCSHCAVSAYVHVCHTPEIGKTHTHSNNKNCMYLEYASPTYTSRKCQHTTECPEICPQNVLQTLGSGLFPTTPCSCLTSLNCLNADSTLISAPCSKLCTDYLISGSC